MHRQPGSLLDRRGFGQGAGLPSSAWRCPACGKGNIASARFCGGCGRLTTLSATIPASTLAKPVSLPRVAPTKSEPLRIRPSETASDAGTIASFKIKTFAPVEPPRRRPVREEPVERAWAEPEPQPAMAPAWTAKNTEQKGFAEEPAPAPGVSLQHRFRQWFGPKLGLFILVGCVLSGLSMSLLILSGFGVRHDVPDTALRQELMKVVPWAELRTWMGTRLGLSPEEVDRLAVKALGAIPVSDRLMMRSQMRRISSWIRGRITEASATLPEISGDGYLLMVDLIRKGRGGESPFNDLPLDHPVYSAWKALLDLELADGLSDAEGRARPYDSLQWEEWTEVCRRIEQRFSGGSPRPREGGARMVGEMSLAALNSALDEMSRFPAFEGRTGGDSQSWKPASNSRMEAFAALSVLLGQSSEGDATATQ